MFRAANAGSLVLSSLWILLAAETASAQCACVGDVNGDLAINLNDVSPFVSALLAGTGACADANNDSLVNGRDIGPFTTLITSGATCVTSGACCDVPVSGGCSIQTALACYSANGVYQGDGSTCIAGLCSKGACCLPDGNCQPFVTAAACGTMSGLYQGNGTICLAVTCTSYGACCTGAGTCSDSVTASNCAMMGGVYHGAGSICQAISCDPDYGACCFDEICVSTLSAADCYEFGGFFMGIGVLCSPGLCGEPHGACCIGSVCVPNMTATSCATASGSYVGDDTDCSVPCVPPPTPGTGACCNGSTCIVGMTQSACQALPGVYQGDGTSCGFSPCSAPTGACCLEGVCYSLQEQVACVAGGGVYLGNGTSCPSGLCTPIPTGACCLPVGSCSTMTQLDCLAQDGFYNGDGSICEKQLESGAPVCAPAMGVPTIKDTSTKALDPKLTASPGADIVCRIEPAGMYEVTTEIKDGATVIRTLPVINNQPGQADFTQNWNGRKDDNSIAPPKKYDIVVQVTGGKKATGEVFVVRVGVTRMDFVNSSDANNAPLQFHRKSVSNLANEAITDEWRLKSLDVGGAARPTPPPHSDFPAAGDDDPVTDGDHFSYPMSYRRGRKLKMTVRTATGAQGFDTPTGAPEVRLRSSFNTGTNHDNIKADTGYDIESTAGILSANVAKTTLNNDFEFFYKHDATTYRSLGTQRTTHIAYTTFDTCAILSGGSYPSARMLVIVLDVTCVAAAGQATQRTVVENCFVPGMRNTGIQYGTLPFSSCRTVDMAFDYKAAMCGTMSQVFKYICHAQGCTGVVARGWNIKLDGDRLTMASTEAGDDPAPAGDPRTITTGPDGLCNTTATAPDTQLLAVGRGKPDTLCVDGYVDGTLQSVPCDRDGNGTADLPACDDRIIGTRVYTGPDGICQTRRRTGTDDVQEITVNQGQPNQPGVSVGGYVQTIPEPPEYVVDFERKWTSIVVAKPGLNRATNPWNAQLWRDVFRNYAHDPAGTFQYLGDASGADDVNIVSVAEPAPANSPARRYEFFAPDDGHAIDFLVDGGHTYLYDPSFIPPAPAAVPAPPTDVYGVTAPLGDKVGNQNANFRTRYYDAAVDFHRGDVVFRDGGIPRRVGRFTVTTSLIPNIATYELHLEWNTTP